MRSGWTGTRAGTDKPCPRCGAAVSQQHARGGRTFDMSIDHKPEDKRPPRRKPNANISGGGGGVFAAKNASMAANRAALVKDGAPTSDGLLGMSVHVRDQDFYRKKVKKEAELGRELSTAEFLAEHYTETGDATATGTSIFDPVLCELAYRWFCPPSGLVLDPFAGGSVRGIVASRLGRRYVGIELRQEQIEANRGQLGIAREPKPEWRCGDAKDIATLAGDVQADLIFSCPPYWNLEVYSEDPRDLSTMGCEAFFTAQAAIIKAALGRLRADRFAAWVVGDVRDASGCYVSLPGRTIAAFEAAGARLYNEAILVTATGSLPQRIGKQFTSGRKLGKTHQNVLVFCKGSWKRAVEALGDVVEFGEVDGAEASDGIGAFGSASLPAFGGSIGGEV